MNDFDFLLGDWRVHNRRRLSVLQDDDRWETFEANNRVFALPGGIGNYDAFEPQGWRPGYVGMSLRLFNPQSRRWSIYWLSNRDGGVDASSGLLGPPVVGSFSGDEGLFEGDDQIEGQPIRVRFHWLKLDQDHARWQQAFSNDGGQRWEVNWTMQFARMAT